MFLEVAGYSGPGEAIDVDCIVAYTEALARLYFLGTASKFLHRLFLIGLWCDCV